MEMNLQPLATHCLVSGEAFAEGARVVSLDAAAEHWAADGLVHIRTDITDEAAVEAAFDAAVIALGGAPDAVVHCAGIYRTRAVTEPSGSTRMSWMSRGGSRVVVMFTMRSKTRAGSPARGVPRHVPQRATR